MSGYDDRDRVDPASSVAGGAGSRQVRIPADIERPDTLVAGLTARQCAILATAAVVIWLLYLPTARWLPLPVFAAIAAPLVGLATAVALGSRDGITADRYLAAMAAHRRAPDLLLPARTPAAQTRVPRGARRVGVLGLPVCGIGADGILDLGADGTAVVCRASTVAFTLRTPDEQDALVAAFGRWLNSLTVPVQLLVRSTPVDLTAVCSHLREVAGALPDPDLEAAARRHADDLTGLAADHDLLARDVLIVLRDPTPTRTSPRGSKRRHAGSKPGSTVTSTSGAACGELLRRARAAADALAAAGVTLTPLTGAAVTRLLGEALHPYGQPRPPAELMAPAGTVVSTSRHPRNGGSSTIGLDPDLGLQATGLQSTVVGELVAPGVLVSPRSLRVGEGWCRSLVVVGYPRDVAPGWLTALTAHTARLDISFQVQPVSPLAATARLRTQQARFESTRRTDATRGRLVDPDLEVAAADARSLAAGIARGQQRLFTVALTITVHAATEAALDAETGRVRDLCASLLIDAQPVTYRQLAAWHTTLPLGGAGLGQGRTFDTSALAAAFPFAGDGLPAQNTTTTTGGPTASGPGTAVLYGVTSTGNGLVRWNRFACENHNAVILARSGAGKSYLAKLELLRAVELGVHAAVIDPDHEYTRLATAVGGTVLALGAPGVRLNPFDLGPHPDALTRRALFLHTLLTLLLGTPLTAAAEAALDRGILLTYARAGITADPRTHRRPPPDLRDLATVLAEDTDPAATSLVQQLQPFTTGSHAGLFTGQTSTRPNGHLVVYSLQHLPEELKSAGTLLTLDTIWGQVSDPAQRRRRMVCVDEAWTLMRDPAGAQFLYRMAKAARKHWCGLTVVTQDAADLLGTDLGQAVVANAATQILLRQAPQSADMLVHRFALTAGERQFLLTARQGEGLLAAGSDRVAFRAWAAPWEHHLITTDPTEQNGVNSPQPQHSQ